jgi:hypothetical protein
MTPGKLTWRKGNGRHYYEDSRFGYGYVDKREDGWLASVPYANALKTLDTLREAKNYVQVQVARRAERRS